MRSSFFTTNPKEEIVKTTINDTNDTKRYNKEVVINDLRKYIINTQIKETPSIGIIQFLINELIDNPIFERVKRSLAIKIKISMVHLISITISGLNPIFKKTYDITMFNEVKRLTKIWYVLILPVACIAIHRGAAIASIRA